MPRRVTVADLESAIRALNDLTGHPATPTERKGNSGSRITACITYPAPR